MSLDRRERAPSGDERRVSFTLPRRLRGDRGASQGEKVESESQEEDVSFNGDCDSPQCDPCYKGGPPTLVKHKKKWKIRLPWGKNKKQKMSRQPDRAETVHEDGSGSDSEKRRSSSTSESDSEKQPKGERGESPRTREGGRGESPRTREGGRGESPRTRPFSWNCDALPLMEEEASNKNEALDGGHHTISVEVLEDHSDSPLPTSKRPKIKLKRFRMKRKKNNENSNSFSYDSSFEVDAILGTKDGGQGSKIEKDSNLKNSSRKSFQDDVSLSYPDVNDSEGKSMECQSQKLGKRFSHSKFVGNLNFIEVDERDDRNAKDVGIKKSNSLPSIFFKKKKSKSKGPEMKKKLKSPKERPKSELKTRGNSEETGGTPESIKVLDNYKRSQSYSNPKPTVALQEDSFNSLVSPSGSITPKPKESNTNNRTLSKSFEPRLTKPVDERPKDEQSNQANFNKHFPPIDNTPKDSLKFIDLFNFKKTSHIAKDKRAASEEILTEESHNKVMSQSFDLRIKRKSYEEMVNLLEEEMFDSDQCSDDDSTDTDGDQVDLSFNKLLEAYGVEGNVQESSGFKLRNCDSSSSSDKEVVYEPKLAKWKRAKASSLPLENNGKKSPTLKRPSRAPPPPPQGSTSPLREEIKPSTENNASGLLQSHSTKVETKERPKKKTHKKVKKVPVNLSTSSSSSFDERLDANFTNRAVKLAPFESSKGKSLGTLSCEKRGLEMGNSLIPNHSGSDSPPDFPPPPVPEVDPPGTLSSYSEEVTGSSGHLRDDHSTKEIGYSPSHQKNFEKITPQKEYSGNKIDFGVSLQDKYFGNRGTTHQMTEANRSLDRRINIDEQYEYSRKKTESKPTDKNDHSDKVKDLQTTQQNEYSERKINFQATNRIGHFGNRMDHQLFQQINFAGKEEGPQPTNPRDYSSERMDLQKSERNNNYSLKKPGSPSTERKEYSGGKMELQTPQPIDCSEKKINLKTTSHNGYPAMKMEFKTSQQSDYSLKRMNFEENYEGHSGKKIDQETTQQSDNSGMEMSLQMTRHKEYSGEKVDLNTTRQSYCSEKVTDFKLAEENDDSLKRMDCEKNHQEEYCEKKMDHQASQQYDYFMSRVDVQTAHKNDWEYPGRSVDYQTIQQSEHPESRKDLRTENLSNYLSKVIGHRAAQQSNYSVRELDLHKTQHEPIEKRFDNQIFSRNDYAGLKVNQNDYSRKKLDLSTTQEQNLPYDPNANSVKLPSATEVAKSLFTKRDESKTYSTDYEDRYLTHLPSKNVNSSSWRSEIFHPPPPPLLPPPEEDPFSGSLSSLASSDLGEQAIAKYRSSSDTQYNSFTGGSFLPSHSSPLNCEEINNPSGSYAEKTEVKPIICETDTCTDPNLSLRSDGKHTLRGLSNTSVLHYEDHQHFTHSSHNPLTGGFPSCNSLPLPPRDEGYKESKRNIVTFHLPPINNEGGSSVSPSPVTVTYRRSSVDQQPHVSVEPTRVKAELPFQEFSTRPGVQTPPETFHTEEKPNFSPMVQRQYLSMKQEQSQFSNAKQDLDISLDPHKENCKGLELLNISNGNDSSNSSRLPHNDGKHTEGQDSSRTFAGTTVGPILSSKRPPPLKGILRNSNKSNFSHKSQHETLQTSTLEHNTRQESTSCYSGEMSNVYRQQLINKLVHSNPANRPVFNSAVERVEIVDDTSESDFETPPVLPSYPPPPARPLSFHQQEFLDDLLRSPQQPSAASGTLYYVPTIVEGSGLRAELDSVYQNVIYASQV